MTHLDKYLDPSMQEKPWLTMPELEYRGAVGLLVFMETHRRILGGKFGRIPKPLSDDAFSMGGYCIDAPDLIPGGGCYYDEFAPSDEDGPNWIVSQFIVNREEAS